MSTGEPAPSSPAFGPLLLNNVVLALIASILMVFLHELSHLVAGIALGHPSTLYPFGVIHHGSPSQGEEAVMALVGPAFSLATGVLMQLWTPLRRRGGSAHLLWLWFAFVSVQEGIAYLCLTPFGAGDTGAAAHLLGIPVWLQVLALLVGVAGMFANARAFATHLARHAGSDNRVRQAMTLYTWLIGMGVSVVLSILYLAISPVELSAADQIAVIAAGTVLLVFAPMAHIFSRAVAGVPYEPLRLPRVPVAALVVLVLLVIGNVLLSAGVRFG